MWKRVTLAGILVILFGVGWMSLRQIRIDVVGQPSLTGFIQRDLEQPFFEGLAASSNLPIRVSYRTNDEVGFRDSYQLPLIRDGELDLVSLRFLQNASHEPTLLGIDPWGLATDLETARKVANAYGPVLDQRLQSRFDAKLLGVWPFGPQIFFCRTPVRKLSDIRGLRVRVGNKNFAPLITAFQATPVVVTFEEVRNALATGMVDCAISSAGSGVAAGWTDYSTHIFTLGTQMGLNGYVISLDTWNRFSKKEQARLEALFNQHIESIWHKVAEVHLSAISCATGGACSNGVRGTLTRSEPSQEDVRMLHDAFRLTTFRDWARRCDEYYPGCSADWRARIEPILNKTFQ